MPNFFYYSSVNNPTFFSQLVGTTPTIVPVPKPTLAPISNAPKSISASYLYIPFDYEQSKLELLPAALDWISKLHQSGKPLPQLIIHGVTSTNVNTLIQQLQPQITPQSYAYGAQLFHPQSTIYILAHGVAGVSQVVSSVQNPTVNNNLLSMADIATRLKNDGFTPNTAQKIKLYVCEEYPGKNKKLMETLQHYLGPQYDSNQFYYYSKKITSYENQHKWVRQGIFTFGRAKDYREELSSKVSFSNPAKQGMTDSNPNQSISRFRLAGL